MAASLAILRAEAACHLLGLDHSSDLLWWEEFRPSMALSKSSLGNSIDMGVECNPYDYRYDYIFSVLKI